MERTAPRVMAATSTVFVVGKEVPRPPTSSPAVPASISASTHLERSTVDNPTARQLPAGERPVAQLLPNARRRDTESHCRFSNRDERMHATINGTACTVNAISAIRRKASAIATARGSQPVQLTDQPRSKIEQRPVVLVLHQPTADQRLDARRLVIEHDHTATLDKTRS
jgi:hypothetical protein